MKFSKSIAVLLTAAMLAAMAGCSDNEENPSGTADKTSAPTQQTAGKENTVNNEGTNAPETEAATRQNTDAPVTEAPGDVPDSYREDGESGIKIIGKNGHYMGLMGCWGTFENCERYAAAVNKAAAALPGVKVYSMVIPTSSEFYVPEDITGFTSSQKEKIDHTADKLSGVANVDVYSALKAHTDEYIYTRTDHHWQPLGAYYAAEVFAKAAGVADKFADISEYKKVTKEGYMGSLYNYSKSLKDHLLRYLLPKRQGKRSVRFTRRRGLLLLFFGQRRQDSKDRNRLR